MLKAYLFAGLLFFTIHAGAQTCPGGDDEPAMKTKIDAGPALLVCGFEDHEVKTPTGSRAFMDFKVYWWTPKLKEAATLFSGEPSATYWAKSDTKGMELTELWFFSDKPEPAVIHGVTCEAETCKLSAPRCILKLKKNPFPNALVKYQKSAKKLGDEGEDVLDQILAQALTGDPSAVRFYEAEPPGIDPRLSEVFESNQRKIAFAKQLKCKLGAQDPK